MPKKIKIFAWVDEQDVARLKEIASRERVPVALITRRAVSSYLSGLPSEPAPLSVDESYWLDAWRSLRSEAPGTADAIARVVRDLVARAQEIGPERPLTHERGRGRRDAARKKP